MSNDALLHKHQTAVERINSILNIKDAEIDIIHEIEEILKEYGLRVKPLTFIQEMAISSVARTIASGTDEIHEAEENDCYACATQRHACEHDGEDDSEGITYEELGKKCADVLNSLAERDEEKELANKVKRLEEMGYKLTKEGE